MKLVPKKVFLVSGKGSHSDALVSFELALRDAGIEKFNLVTVSSILPPNCEIVDKEEGLKHLSPGEIVFTVMARYTSNQAGKKIFASIGLARPEKGHGYLTEYSGEWDKSVDEKHAEKMAELMVESMGSKATFKKTVFEVAEVREFTTVVSAAVFVL
ncbi:arginine decarboxylase [Archaeoglobus sulfaticallidus PM70-1]|uniref:Pyruvoyl-dependent arginine decarboxylase n=1 Tax=Archaeoglobus sulfaticallidus PM70-1 TaxID=387631 RepID=N0BH39_9EURY|nr:arginine decarboxylase, pyruvoyl-dependent [Archaeoglobus sulfaticallidus]AGK61602.1 arginine decarboxylase [Archaeoglobus sulfaticallidus PM70-1]